MQLRDEANGILHRDRQPQRVRRRRLLRLRPGQHTLACLCCRRLGMACALGMTAAGAAWVVHAGNGSAVISWQDLLLLALLRGQALLALCVLVLVLVLVLLLLPFVVSFLVLTCN